MTVTNLTLSNKGKRSALNFSDEKRRDSLLREAWGKIVAGFKPKPEPSSAWYEAASGDTTPWRLVVTPIRMAILAAKESGNKELLEETLNGARAFCAELEADFTSLVPNESDLSIIATALEETQVQGEADPYEISLAANPSPIEAERAIRPLARHHAALTALLDKCRRLARQPSVRRAW